MSYLCKPAGLELNNILHHSECVLEDLSHQAAKLREEVSRLYNNSKTEKETDQIPFKTVQLQQALTPSCYVH